MITLQLKKDKTSLIYLLLLLLLLLLYDLYLQSGDDLMDNLPLFTCKFDHWCISNLELMTAIFVFS